MAVSHTRQKPFSNSRKINGSKIQASKGELIKSVISRVVPSASAAKPRLMFPKNYKELVDNLVRTHRGAKPVSGTEASKLNEIFDDLYRSPFGYTPRQPPKGYIDFIRKMTSPLGLGVGAAGGALVGSIPGQVAQLPVDIASAFGKYPNLAEYYSSRSGITDRLKGTGMGLGAGAVLGGMLGSRRALFKALSNAKLLQSQRNTILDAIRRHPKFGKNPDLFLSTYRQSQRTLDEAIPDALGQITGDYILRDAGRGAAAGLLPGLGLGEGFSQLSKSRAENPKYKEQVFQRWGPFSYFAKEKQSMDKASAGATATFLQKLLSLYYSRTGDNKVQKILSEAVLPTASAPAATTAEEIRDQVSLGLGG